MVRKSAPFIYLIIKYHVNDPGLSHIEINVTLLHYYSGPSIKLFPSSTIIDIGNSSSVNVRGRELEHYFIEGHCMSSENAYVEMSEQK